MSESSENLNNDDNELVKKNSKSHYSTNNENIEGEENNEFDLQNEDNPEINNQSENNDNIQDSSNKKKESKADKENDPRSQLL